jgi:hypothetical protein
MTIRKCKIARSGMLGAFFLLSLQAFTQEFVKAKVFDKTPDQVFAAAEQVVRQNDITVLERDERTRTIRFRLRSFQSSSVREQYTGAYAIFTAEPDLEHGGTTKAWLTVGNINVPQTGFPPASMNRHGQIPEPAFSKKFFKQLKKELKI